MPGTNRFNENTCRIFIPTQMAAGKNRKKARGCFTPITTGVSTHRVAILSNSWLPIQSAIGCEYR
jgi:hypothetical protein